MYKRIEQMPSGPPWHSRVEVVPEAPNESHTWFYCDVKECAEWLLANPAFENHMGYEAQEVFEANGVTRVYHEMYTGKLWNEVQVCVPISG